ncbi:hypothetical protein, partial [Pelagibius sp.]|uniref:hypothetical protein n=1 Tax=Pelagibius sp. TaxID=1931238 RepID=UPI00260A3CC0
QHKKRGGLEESEIYRANVMAMKELAPRVRGFDPKNLKAGNSTINRLVMWWKEETAQDVAKQVLDEKGAEMADRFASVWRHLSMLNALAESNQDLTQDLNDLPRQLATLRTNVRRYLQDQYVALAILKQFKVWGDLKNGSGGPMADFDLKHEETLRKVQRSLDSWGLPDAWTGFAARNPAIVENGITTKVLQNWRSEASGPGAELRSEFDQLNRALDDFEQLIKVVADAQKTMAGTPLDRRNVEQYGAQQVEAKLLSLLPQKAGHHYRRMLNSAAEWHEHTDWTGPEAREMHEMTPAAFLRALRVGLVTFSQKIESTESGKRLKDEARENDRKWINEKLLPLLDQVETFDNDVKSGLAPEGYLRELGNKIIAAAEALHPDKSDGKRHRFKSKGPAKHRYRVPSEHFLNKIDTDLHAALPVMVRSQLAQHGR